MDTSSVLAKGPEWANGCEHCKFGIVLAPEITGAVEFYLERLVQAIDGDITFCSCQAGIYYRSALLNRRQKLLDDAKHDPRMQESASRRTHPDIENARQAMLENMGKMHHEPPTIHYEAQPTPEPVAEVTP